MIKVSEMVWMAFVLLLFVFLCLENPHAFADTSEFRQSTQLYPSEYLLQSREPRHDPVFDHARVIDLSATIGVGSDCGRIDFKSTLRATLSNVLDTKYFGNMGADILAASPMLLTCYFSPTWCAILKHSQVSAHWLSQMRLDQCSLVDKYTDSRVEDFYQERQGCVRQAIERNGGDMEAAMQSCNGNSLWNADLANWAGGRYGDKVSSNRLIDSSAKWAGMDNPESQGSLGLLKGLVGDSVVSRGSVSVEYGPYKAALTPRTYLQSIEQTTYDKLCSGIVKKVVDAGDSVNVDQAVSDEELRSLSPNKDALLVDRQTVRALLYMGPRQRQAACQKLSDAVALTVFSTDINRSLDILTTLSQNPNLPDNRKKEIENKRKALKEQVEMTVTLQRSRNEPLNQVLSQINEAGGTLESEAIGQDLSRDAAAARGDANAHELMNCSDGVMCE